MQQGASTRKGKITLRKMVPYVNDGKSYSSCHRKNRSNQYRQFTFWLSNREWKQIIKTIFTAFNIFRGRRDFPRGSFEPKGSFCRLLCCIQGQDALFMNSKEEGQTVHSVGWKVECQRVRQKKPGCCRLTAVKGNLMRLICRPELAVSGSELFVSADIVVVVCPALLFR